jgi:translocation and assembly module TamB
MFDSEVAANNYSGDEMMKMMGGAMAKSLLSDMGINFDHLVLGAKNSIEVGKRLNGSTTLIYVNEQGISRAKIKYDFSNSLEGVISVSSQSSSADILYKKEFKTLDPRDKNTTLR